MARKMRKIVNLNQEKIRRAAMAVREGTPVSELGTVLDVTNRTVSNYLRRGQDIFDEKRLPETPDERLCLEFYEQITDARYYGKAYAKTEHLVHAD